MGFRSYLHRTQLGRTIGIIRAELKQEPATDTGEACSDGVHCEQRKEPIDACGDQPDTH